MASVQSNATSSSGSTASHSGRKTIIGDRFIVGEELGRGAYGQVFKGMDAKNGESVAIKQISLQGVSHDNLHSIMGEIDLLKTLNHKNIVKYMGSFKTRTHLYIILEFMENGSLSSVIKPNRFGVFPETLIAVYIAQVLQGLQYLHQQGVVHRDIKGANILTTKEGVVKLADFGVAAKLGELEEGMHQNVVGTPYWMAPEVIEMTQVTSASDIWSVGCLIIELLTGYPPYFDLQPMSALFRIVQDELPPLPDNISALLADFLVQCFQKNPRDRPSAARLLQHEWISHNKRTLRRTWGHTAGLKAQGTYSPEVYAPVSVVVERILHLEDPGTSNSEAGTEGDHIESVSEHQDMPLSSTPNSPLASLEATLKPLSISAPSTLSRPLQSPVTSPSQLSTPGAIEVAKQDSASPPAPALGPSPEHLDRNQRRTDQQHPPGEPLSFSQVGSDPQTKYTPDQRHAQTASQPQWWSSKSRAPPPTHQSGLQSNGYIVSDHRQGQQYTSEQAQGGMDGGLPFSPPKQDEGAGPRLMGEQQAGGDKPGAVGGLLRMRASAENPISSSAVAPQRSRRLLERSDLSANHARSHSGPAAPQLAERQTLGINSLGAGSLSQPPSRGGSLHSVSEVGFEPGPEALLDPALVSRSATLSPERVSLPNSLGRLTEDEEAVFQGEENLLSPPRSRLTRSLDDMGRPPLHPRSPNMNPSDRGSTGDADSLAAAQARLMPVRTSSNSGEVQTRLLSESADSALATLLKRLQGDSPSTPPGAGIMSWLEDQSHAERPYSEAFSLNHTLPAVKSSYVSPLSTTSPTHVDSESHDGSGSMELRKQLRGLVRSMRPNSKEGVIAPMDACSIVASMFARQPEAAVHFYSEDGLLVLLELLESDDVKYQEGAMELLASLCSTAEPQLSQVLEAICLRGMVPAIGRMLTVGNHQLQLRSRSAFVVSKMVHSHPTILQLFVAGGGLQYLVKMLQHDNLTELAGLQLAMQGIVCVQKVMEMNFVVSVNHILRIMAQYNLGHRLALVLYKLMYLRHRQSFRTHGRENSIASMSDLHSPLGGRELLDPDTRSIPSMTHSRSASSMTDRPLLLEYGRSARGSDRKQGMSSVSPAAQIETDFLLNRVIDMLLVMSCGDPVVKQFLCTKQNLQCMLDSVQRMHAPFLMRLMRCIRNLTSEPSVITALQEAGTIPVLVPFLGPARAKEGLEVQVEALTALYNICRANKRIHLELAANDHIVPHLCRFATQTTKAADLLKQRMQAPETSGMTDQDLQVLEDEQALRQRALQSYVVPMLIGMVSASPRTRAKLWGSNGPDTFLSLLITQEPQLQVVVLRALDTWLSEDITRMESRLSMAASVNAIVRAFAQQCTDSTSLTQLLEMLECLKQMVSRSPKLVVAVTNAGIVKHLKAILLDTPPLVRARTLELIRCLYQHQPRPKEFIMMYKLQDTLRQLHLGNGPGDEMVRLEAQKLLQAFNVNSLL